MNNIYEELEKSFERQRLFFLSIKSVCFTSLVLFFIEQDQTIQSILMFLTLQGIVFGQGVFSKYFTPWKLILFLILLSTGIQLLFLQANQLNENYLSSQIQGGGKQADFGIIYYFFGVFHVLIVKSVSNIYIKIILSIFLFQTTIALINKWQIQNCCFIFGQLIFAVMIILFALEDFQIKKIITCFKNLTQQFSQIYKQSCDSIITSSLISNNYEIKFVDNPNSSYYSSHFKNCFQSFETSTRNQQKAQHNNVLNGLKIQQFQINQKNQQSSIFTSEIIQKIQEQSCTLDYLIQLLFKHKQLWSGPKIQGKSCQITLNQANIIQKYSKQPRNSLTLKNKQRELCSFYIQAVNLQNLNEAQDLKFQPFIYEGKIFNVKNPFTEDRQQNQNILENNQLTKASKASEFYNTISVNTHLIQQVLKIPSIQSVNEILAKIQLMKNIKKVNETANVLTFESDQDVSPGTNNNQNQLLNQKPALKRNVQDQMNKIKINNNLTILQQNILYLQSILQYEHLFIKSELLKEQIQMKIQKFYLQEFLDEIKGIISTQFYSYLQRFNIQNYDKEQLKLELVKDQVPNLSNPKILNQNNELKIYLYTDLTILKYILIFICEKIIKANDFEKNQKLNLYVKNEDKNCLSFIIQFSQIKRKIFIENHLQYSLNLLGSKLGFQQQLKSYNSDLAYQQTNNSQKYPELKNLQADINDETKYDQENQEEFCETINQIKFTISKDLSCQKKNADAFILNSLRDCKYEKNSKQQQDLTKILDKSQEFQGEVRERQQSKYRDQKLEYLVESLRFDQFDTFFSAASEPFDNQDTEQQIRFKKPSIFSKIIKNNNISLDNKILSIQTQNKLYSQEKSFKEINQTKTVFIILEHLQQKDEIEATIQQKFNLFTNIYEFQTMVECIKKLQSDKIYPEILVVDSKIFIESEYSLFQKLFNFIQTNCKSTFKFFIFNNELEEQDNLQQIFYKPHFKIVKYTQVDNFLNEFFK